MRTSEHGLIVLLPLLLLISFVGVWLSLEGELLTLIKTRQAVLHAEKAEERILQQIMLSGDSVEPSLRSLHCSMLTANAGVTLLARQLCAIRSNPGREAIDAAMLIEKIAHEALECPSGFIRKSAPLAWRESSASISSFSCEANSLILRTPFVTTSNLEISRAELDPEEDLVLGALGSISADTLLAAPGLTTLLAGGDMIIGDLTLRDGAVLELISMTGDITISRINGPLEFLRARAHGTISPSGIFPVSPSSSVPLVIFEIFSLTPSFERRMGAPEKLE